MKSGKKTGKSGRGWNAWRPGRCSAVAASRLLSTNDLVGPSPLRRFQYTTPAGTHVVLQLFGAGELNGTTVDSDGSLNLRFSGTNQQSGVIADVHGGTGLVLLRSLQSLTLPFGSLSGIGGSLINVVNLQKFDLVPGGRINLTSGVHELR